MIRRLLRAPLAWVVVAVVVTAGAFGLYWFQPWKLVTDREVAEALSSPGPVPASPGPAPAARVSASSTPSVGAPVAPVAPSAPPPGPVLVSRGDFVTHEHDTSGTVRIVRFADGSRRLELVGLATSNGPDLRVWLTDQPVLAGAAGWHVFDDGKWVELGRLKGNRGDQAYGIPANLDLGQFRSVSIWCKRFSVSFGAAALTSG
jgi:hypothetical protein